MNKKSNNGITLIALVITIIVLLILAGVTINMVLGEDGIITQATNASLKTDKEQDIVRIQLKVQSAKIEGLGKLTSEKAINRLNSELGLEGDNKIKNLPTIFEEDDRKYWIGEDGTVLIKTVVPENYGKLTNYEYDIDGNGKYDDWKIFYDDGENVYLIAKDYINFGNTESTNAAGMTTNGYKAYWPSNGGIRVKGTDAVASLLNKDNWTEYKDSDGKAEYVIGAPTLEMWVNSWNEKGYQKLYIEKIEEQNGYYVGIQENLKDIVESEIEEEEKWKKGGVLIEIQEYGDSDDETGYYDTLYFNTKKNSTTANGYFLASPFMTNSIRDIIDSENTTAAINFINTNYDQIGLRPVVCLKSGVQFEENEEIWNIVD